MKYLKDFKIFENRQSDEEIHTLCKKYVIFNYSINSDGSINCTRGVFLNGENLYKIPIKFNRVDNEWFYIKHQRKHRSL